jgi:hypothetical protein
MTFYGEKFIERKINDNKLINIYEFKTFEYDYEDIVQDINDFITDDVEQLYYDYGISQNFNEEWFMLDCDTCIDGINDYINALEEDEVEDYEWLKNYLPILEAAKGFTIYLQNDAKDYTNYKVPQE